MFPERVSETFRSMELGSTDILLAVLLPRLRLPGACGAAWSTEFGDGRLELCLIADRPGTVRYLSPMDVVGLGVGLARAQSLAFDNLRNRSPHGRWVDIGEGFSGHRSQVRDGHDASRVLVAEQWFTDPLGLLVLAPTRDLGFVLPCSTPRAIEEAIALHEVALDLVATEAYAISADVFWLVGGALRHLPIQGAEGSRCFIDLPSELRGSKGSSPG